MSDIFHCIGIVRLNSINDTTIRERNESTVICETMGYPPPTVEWNRINGILSDRVSVSDSVSVPTGYGNVTRVSVNLTITNASREDTGLYTCFAYNNISSNDTNISITIQCEFMFIIWHDIRKCHSSLVQAEITEGVIDMLENETNPITFSCKAIGEPVPNISWYFNGELIDVPNGSKYIVSNSSNGTKVISLLTVMYTQSSDVGRYICFAENIIGSDQSSGVLTVNGKELCLLYLHLFD